MSHPAAHELITELLERLQWYIDEGDTSDDEGKAFWIRERRRAVLTATKAWAWLTVNPAAELTLQQHLDELQAAADEEELQRHLNPPLGADPPPVPALSIGFDGNWKQAEAGLASAIDNLKHQGPDPNPAQP